MGVTEQEHIHHMRDKMTKHQIILSSSYSEGTRICMDFTDCDSGMFKSVMDKVSAAYDGKSVSFSIHTVHTDSAEWESVVERDPYFRDVRVIGTADEFVKLIQKDRYLKGIDVARYILSVFKCTHTRIEKLTYMCYADYLCSTGERLFDDKVYAFQYGPVIDSVYKEFKGYSKESPGDAIDDRIYSLDLKLQMKSRILFSEDGDKKLDSIRRTLERYKQISTSRLVELTHIEGSPWSRVYVKAESSDDSMYMAIPDQYIRQYHHVEECS